mmetsp:Transcript_16291/g.38812  ORF Transcript_16291/g.38812 Transcript_16291/m.38812 type:complete len:128 (+) Transcript_16291:953-1336(+)
MAVGRRLHEARLSVRDLCVTPNDINPAALKAMRLASLKQDEMGSSGDTLISVRNERAAYRAIAEACSRRLAAFPKPLETRQHQRESTSDPTEAMLLKFVVKEMETLRAAEGEMRRRLKNTKLTKTEL